MDHAATDSSRESVVSLKKSENTPEYDLLLDSGRVYEKEGSVFYRLKYPVKIEKLPELSELKFRRPKAKHSKQIRFSTESEIAILLEMTCALTDISKYQADELDLWDIQNIGTIIGNFSYHPPQTF
jgi:hypothetical protein